MWTGNKPPRIPVVTPTKDATNGATVKNGRVDAELAALKQRGLAKILNKHFTETAAKLASEKAAADAACLDLQERKARTSEFKESGNGALSPLDEACIKANQWRAECRRKERETLLLYQRYVNKYGDAVVNVAKLSNPNSGMIDSSRTSAPPLTRLPPLAPPGPRNGTLVPNMAAQIETSLEEYLKLGGMAHPSVMVHGTDQTFANAAQKEEAAFRDHYRRLLEQRGVDAVCGPGYYKASQHGEMEGLAGASDIAVSGGNNVDVFTRTVDEQKLDAAVAAGMRALENVPLEAIHGPITGLPNMNDHSDNDDQASIVSGLTTLHSAMTRELLHDCERSVQTFLREEQAHIRKIIEEESTDGDGSYDDNDDHTTMAVQDAKKTAKQAESMVAQMQEILLEYQKKHTMDVTGKDLEKKKGRPYPTSNDDEEWVVYYDELYQQEYYHETKTNRTQWEPPDRDSSGSFSTDVYSVSERDLQLDSLSLSSSAGGVGAAGATGQRVAAYRRKRRLQRRRRRIIVAFLSIVAAVVGVAYYQCQVLEPHHPMCATVQHEAVELWKDIVSGGEYKKALAAEKASKARALIVEQEELLQLQQEQAQAEAAERARLVALEEAERLAREKAEELERQRQKALMLRPWACNLPFSYLFHSRCRRLATLNPVFDLYGLVQSMLQ